METILTAPAAPGITILKPACVPKYTDTLPLPLLMVKDTSSTTSMARYTISVRQVQQNVLPMTAAPGASTTCPGYTPGRMTTVFGYGQTFANGVNTHGWPARTIEAKKDQAVRVSWENKLVNADGTYLQHILKDSIDQTIHWANPGKLGGMGTDMSPCMNCVKFSNCSSDAGCQLAATTVYTGAVPMVTHLHGASKAYDFSDGYSEAWYLPVASNIPASYAKNGAWYDIFAGEALRQLGDTWRPGRAIYTYKNQQNPTQMWYHDHTVGLTRLNVYAGMAGLYFLRNLDATQLATTPELTGLPYPPPGALLSNGQPVASTAVREIPLAIQDRIFDINSNLYYPVSKGSGGDLPNGPVPPKWIPELVSVTTDGQPISTAAANGAACMVVNGKTWPTLTVQREPYRLRILNGCNARTLVLYFTLIAPNATNLIRAARWPFYVIGNEAGFFPSIVGPVETLLMGPAERYDILFDFAQLPRTDGDRTRRSLYLANEGPDAPYAGVKSRVGLNEHTAQVMRFLVEPTPGTVDFTRNLQYLKTGLAQYTPVQLPAPAKIRQFTLSEYADAASGAIISILLGRAGTDADGNNIAIPETWSDPVSTIAAENSVEDWEMINLTVDSHPIHIHETYFQVVRMRNITTGLNAAGQVTWVYGPNTNPNVYNNNSIIEAPCGATSTCKVNKDTYLVPPGTATTFRLKTNSKGLFPWHCHLVEHEDNEMMRPWCVGQPGYTNPQTRTPMCPPPNR